MGYDSALDSKAAVRSHSAVSSKLAVILCALSLMITAGLAVYVFVSQREAINTLQARIAILEKKVYAEGRTEKESNDLYFTDDIQPILDTHQGLVDERAIPEVADVHYPKSVRIKRNGDTGEGSGTVGNKRRKHRKGKKGGKGGMKKRVAKLETETKKLKQDTISAKNRVENLETETRSLKQRIDRLTRHVENSTSNTIYGAHYVGDVDGTFPDWVPAQWMVGYSYSDRFEKQPDGSIRVKDGGLYWIYAQITFYNSEPSNTIVVNIRTQDRSPETRLLTCSHSNAPIPADKNPDECLQAHTCSGGGLIRVQGDAQVWVQGPEATIYWTSDRSYFGMVRLA